MTDDDMGIADLPLALAREFRDLLLPRGCAGCDAPDEVLCPRCLALFEGAHERSLPSMRQAWCHACAFYEGAARRAILSWKDHGDEECDRVFARCLADLALRTADLESPARERDGDAPGVLLVPAPSSPASKRRRGRWQMAPVVRMMARILADEGVAARPLPILRLNGVRGKSVQANGSLARSRRIDGHVRAVRRVDDGAALVLVVDDIVTTGSTMGQCVKALRAAGAGQVAGLALACTAPRGGRP
ncbi:phosphoribosyltransferase family protein [Bifidobacterium sp. ESL0763]|uniref:ComF family protein n=1 Tax=Bifidobacterium sp. ESL0763 TaxID=2983227 RepID=UPI0023F9E54F|nr:phosphoribosyltransferase family protein [Bifidobacterium sp. ESL0763]MDF7663979.1 phosphoribosyltransferase family protein [Bifidobacterium sp. ESL0763]